MSLPSLKNRWKKALRNPCFYACWIFLILFIWMFSEVIILK